MDKKYDLAIAYRIYAKPPKRSPIFQNDKYKLSKLCLKSFKKSLGSLKAKIWVLLDDCPPEYEDLFRLYFDEEDLILIKLNGIGNSATFGLQIKILLEQNVSEIIYFAEDDYYYFPNQFKELIHFLKENSDVDFVTPNDHIDNYTTEFHRHKNELRQFNKRFWKTTNGTCLTFLTTKKNLFKTRNSFMLYYKGFVSDAMLFIMLTKKRIFNIYVILKFLFTDRYFFFIYFLAWVYGWKQILFGKKWKVWRPIPTIGAHLVQNLPPKIEWKQIFDNEIKNLAE